MTPTYREYRDWLGTVTLDYSQGGELAAIIRAVELQEEGYEVEAHEGSTIYLTPGPAVKNPLPPSGQSLSEQQ